jgi:hypothetical protein
MEKERPGSFVAWLLQMKSQNIRKRKTINFMNDREKGLLKERTVITFSPQHKHVPAPMNILMFIHHAQTHSSDTIFWLFTMWNIYAFSAVHKPISDSWLRGVLRLLEARGGVC